MHRKGFVLCWVFSVLVFLLSTPVPLNGQSLNTGIFGGVNISQVRGDAYQGFNKLGFNTGIYVNRLIEKDFYWQVELKFSSRGVYKGLSDMDQTLYKSAYYIMELPLSIHYIFDGKIMLELGTSPELLMSTRFWDENGLLDKSSYPDNRRLGLSVFAGVAYWFNDRLMAGFRYTNSAIPFRDPEEWNNPQYRGYFHNVISLSMAYGFTPH